MTDIAIRVENLGKLYRIGAAQQRHDTLRDALMGYPPRIHTKKNKTSENSSNSWQKEPDDILWALRDVSFEVKRGEVVGVIEPPRALGALELRALWAYHELLYLMEWRDLKVYYKQTGLGC